MNQIDCTAIQGTILLDRQFRLIKRVAADFRITRDLLETQIEQGGAAFDTVLDAYNQVFSLIDHIERYRKTSLSIPRLNQKDLEHRNLVAALRGFTVARNQLQHLNNCIDNSFSGPMLGAISWTSGEYQFLISLHDLGRHRSSPAIPFDPSSGQHLHELCFSYNEMCFDIARAVVEIEKFNAYILNRMQIAVDGKPYNSADHVMCVRMRFARWS